MQHNSLRFVVAAVLTITLVQAPAKAQLNHSMGTQGSRFSSNPAPFENNLAPISPSLRLFVWKQQRRLATNQITFQPEVSTNSGPLPTIEIEAAKSAQSIVAPSSGVSSPCNSSAGALFNLEPVTGSPHIGFPVPQNSESVDFIPEGGNLGSDLVVESAVDYRGIVDFFLTPYGGFLPTSWGLSETGYYVHRIGNDCSVSFEGGFPHIQFAPTGENIYSSGEPILAANPTRNRFYAADLRFGDSVTGIGLLSTTASRLNDPLYCPNGTHLTDVNGHDTVSSLCWPSGVLLDPRRPQSPSTYTYPDKPYVRTDERPSGVGAGNVYVSWTSFDFNRGISYIQIAACPYNFVTAAKCSRPITISGSDPNTQLSQLSVRQDVVVTITYLNYRFPIIDLHEVELLDIKYVSCRPHPASGVLVCSTPSLVFTENQPLLSSVFLFADALPFWTYPVHDSRTNGNSYEDFIVWARCSVDPYLFVGSLRFDGCPDSEIVMTWSATDRFGIPQGWATPVAVNANPGNQVMPSISTDHASNTINIGYLSAEQDPYLHRYQVFQAQILPGAYSISTQQPVVAPLPDEPAADPFFLTFSRLNNGTSLGLGAGPFGGYIGVAARSTSTQSHAYFGFTGQIYQGLFQGQMVSGSNNLLSAVSY